MQTNEFERQLAQLTPRLLRPITLSVVTKPQWSEPQAKLLRPYLLATASGFLLGAVCCWFVISQFFFIAPKTPIPPISQAMEPPFYVLDETALGSVQMAGDLMRVYKHQPRETVSRNKETPTTVFSLKDR